MAFNKVSFLLLLVTALAVCQSSTTKEFTLDLRAPSKEAYSTFLADIRKTLKAPNLTYGGTDIPVIGPPTKTYHRINLQTLVGDVSLGIRQSDVYLVAYLAKNNQQRQRAYFFKGQIESPQLEEIFPEAKGGANQQEIKEYVFSYASLTAAGGNTTVKKAGLGISKLISYTGAVAGKKRIVKDEAKLILVAVQMVSEAVRYRYIEDTVLSHFPNGFTLEDKLIILEKNWGTISTDIKASKNGVFTPPKEYKTLDVTTSWTVSTVAELNVGLLKYCGP